MSILSALRKMAQQMSDVVDVEMPSATPEQMRQAQINAALPVEQGGLGLPVDNTPDMRARAMGMQTPAYHFGSSGIREFDPNLGIRERSGAGVFVAKDPRVAASYFKPDGSMYPIVMDISGMGRVDTSGSLWGDLGGGLEYVNRSKFESNLDDFNPIHTTNDLGRWARDEGDTGVQIDQVIDLGGHSIKARDVHKALGKEESFIDFLQDYERLGDTNYAIQDTSIMRSPNAAFDPMRRNSRDITAGVGGVGVLGLIGEEENGN